MKGVRNTQKSGMRIGRLFGWMLTTVCFLHSCGALKAAELEDEVNGSENRIARSHGEVVTQINQYLRKGYRVRGLEPASLCGDPVFVRRVYLDLVGRIPTVGRSCRAPPKEGPAGFRGILRSPIAPAEPRREQSRRTGHCSFFPKRRSAPIKTGADL